jgi:hypothetical protein
MHKNMRENALSFVFLALVGLLLTSCLPASQAEEPPTVTPRPTQALSGSVQAGELEELLDVNEQLRDVSISEFQVNGDVALAITGKDGQPNLIAINLRSGEIAGLDISLGTGNQWLTTERYFAWTASDVPDDPARSLRVYDIHTGEEFTVEGEGLSQCCADVSGNIVVWSEIHAGRGGDIYAYDISSRELLPVVTRSLGQAYPKIEGDWVVYLEDKHSNDPRDPMRDLYLHNLATGEDTFIGPSPFASSLEGDTYGIANGRVLWIGWTSEETPDLLSGDRPSLHLYDLRTRTKSIVDLSPVCTRVPACFEMAGDLILFNCEGGFYGYDLAQEVFFDVPYPRHSVGSVYFSETYAVFRTQVQGESIWDYMTPGASPMPPEEHWLTPQPRQYRLFVVPITR